MIYLLTAFVLAHLEAGYGWWILFALCLVLDFVRSLP
jgi:hypothetical protein